MPKVQRNPLAIAEPVIDSVQRLPARAAMNTARSLKPGVAIMEAAAQGQPEACVIRDSWRFNYLIRLVTPEQFTEMTGYGEVIFHG